MRSDYQLDLEDTVRSVVNSFMDSETLFTALDVSNEVKKAVPTARHKDVRNEVRRLFADVIEPAGWARSEIDVKLENGDVVQALLYHPLSASWSLDELYDDQKRSQVSAKPTTAQKSLNDMLHDDTGVDYCSDKDYTVATTVDWGNIVQTTVFPSVDPIMASLSVDSATAPSLTQPTYNLPPPAAATEEVPPVPSTDLLYKFAEDYKRLTNELYAALGVSEEDAKALVEEAKGNIKGFSTSVVNRFLSFLNRK